MANLVLENLGLSYGEKLNFKFTRNIPVGKGLNSSTADMLAVIRALQEIYGFIASEKFISKLFNQIEPHEGLQYYTCVSHNHRKGKLINKYNHIPDFKILVVDTGGKVSTDEYNRNIKFNKKSLNFYDEILEKINFAFKKKNDNQIAKLSTQACKYHCELNKIKIFNKLYAISKQIKSLGIIKTYSGTCYGLIFPSSFKDRKLFSYYKKFNKIGKCKIIKTLKIL